MDYLCVLSAALVLSFAQTDRITEAINAIVLYSRDYRRREYTGVLCAGMIFALHYAMCFTHIVYISSVRYFVDVVHARI